VVGKDWNKGRYIVQQIEAIAMANRKNTHDAGEIGCAKCGTYDKHDDPCEKCGNVIHIGSTVHCPHDRAAPTKGFESYWDIQLTDHPVQITSLADRNKYMRPHWKDDHVIHFRDRD
jgi:hypothetical protein